MIAQLLKAYQDGSKVDLKDENAIAQYVMSLLSVGVGYLPYVGPALSAFTNLLSSVLFPSSGQSTDALWKKLNDRIGALVDQKIADYDAETLRAKLDGVSRQLNTYSDAVKNYEKASAQEKKQAAEHLRDVQTAALISIEGAVPEFQKDSFAVASLPMFAAAANAHLMLLSDGVKQGAKWGYDSGTIAGMRADLKRMTTPGAPSEGGKERTSEKKKALDEAIGKASELNVPKEVVADWKSAAEKLAKGKEEAGSTDKENYVDWANKTYEEGRKKVKPSQGIINDSGGKEANELKAYADYDNAMRFNVLDYAKLWPYLADKMPDSAKAGLDRESFYGPYGRGTDGAPWSASAQAPTEKRGAPITAVRIWGYDSVDAVQVKYGDTWGEKMGDDGGELKEIALDKDEYITKVKAQYGQKIGSLEFTTNKGRTLANGNGKYADGHDYPAQSLDLAPAAQALSSIRITQSSETQPPGTEGIVLGFRSLLTG
ncbi:insecticidal delta-endotoxin Cry8Ea1 family protein [Streptomyces sp. NPDC001941]|uniref:insecticidal delta-endotoxin Cry8Ea1 family protein n=1 Tax=Streptomyces sp. NPDC001941 TaxID=3154659 RepID=UPI003316F6B6